MTVFTILSDFLVAANHKDPGTIELLFELARSPRRAR
jgi:hypothetical protein